MRAAACRDNQFTAGVIEMIDQHPERKRWWASEWFWGGVVPILPPVVLFVVTLSGIPVPGGGWVLVFSAIPLSLLVAAAVVVLGREALLEMTLDSGARRAALIALSAAVLFGTLYFGVYAA